MAKEAAGDVLSSAIDKDGIKILTAAIPDTDMNSLRNLGDDFKSKLGDSVVVLASAKDGSLPWLQTAQLLREPMPVISSRPWLAL